MVGRCWGFPHLPLKRCWYKQLSCCSQLVGDLHPGIPKLWVTMRELLDLWPIVKVHSRLVTFLFLFFCLYLQIVKIVILSTGFSDWKDSRLVCFNKLYFIVGFVLHSWIDVKNTMKHKLNVSAMFVQILLPKEIVFWTSSFRTHRSHLPSEKKNIYGGSKQVKLLRPYNLWHYITARQMMCMKNIKCDMSVENDHKKCCHGNVKRGQRYPIFDLFRLIT